MSKGKRTFPSRKSKRTPAEESHPLLHRGDSWLPRLGCFSLLLLPLRSTPRRAPPTSNHSTAMQIHWLRRASGSRTRHWGGCSAASTSWSPWPTPPRLSSSSDDSVPRVAQAHGLAPRASMSKLIPDDWGGSTSPWIEAGGAPARSGGTPAVSLLRIELPPGSTPSVLGEGGGGGRRGW
jgi:hypothetical protein